MRLLLPHPPKISWLKRWLPVLLWAALIFFMSHQSKATLAPMQPSGIVHEPGVMLFGVDADTLVGKSAHVFLFAVLAGLLWRATSSVGTAFFLLILYAGLDEWHQSFVPGRTPRLTDVGFDAAGAAVMLLVLWGWDRFRPKPSP